jgi:hypothetical protein
MLHGVSGPKTPLISLLHEVNVNRGGIHQNLSCCQLASGSNSSCFLNPGPNPDPGSLSRVRPGKWQLGMVIIPDLNSKILRQFTQNLFLNLILVKFMDTNWLRQIFVFPSFFVLLRIWQNCGAVNISYGSCSLNPNNGSGSSSQTKIFAAFGFLFLSRTVLLDT